MTMKRLCVLLALAVSFFVYSANAREDNLFSKLTEDNHPRIFLKSEDFATLKQKNVPGSTVNALHNILIAIADTTVVSGKTLKYKLDPSGKRILPISRNALKRISACAYAYRMTGEANHI